MAFYFKKWVTWEHFLGAETKRRNAVVPPPSAPHRQKHKVAYGYGLGRYLHTGSIGHKNVAGGRAEVLAWVCMSR